MKAMDGISLLRQNLSRHIQLTDAEFTRIAAAAEPRHLRKKEFLLQAGEVCRHECFVTKGCLRSYYIDKEGEEHVLFFAMEDWWVSDLASFVTGTPAFLYIDALEDTDVLLIEKNRKEQLYLDVPKFERAYRIMVQIAFAHLQRRLVVSMSETADQRYLELIQRYPNLEQRVPQHQIASYLGISAEFLSKIRRRLQDSQ